MTPEIFEAITEWQKSVFTQATPVSQAKHLEREAEELRKDLETGNPERRLEFADCLFLLFGAAVADGMTYQDLCNALTEKLELNKARKWQKPDKNGIVFHVK